MVKAGEGTDDECLHPSRTVFLASIPCGEGVKAKNTCYCRVYAREGDFLMGMLNVLVFRDFLVQFIGRLK